MSRAIADFDMIADGDRIICAVSGGKDSYAMLHLLVDLAKRAPVRFELIVVNIDQGHPGYPGHRLRAHGRREATPSGWSQEDTYSIVTDKIPEGKTYCSLCSRLRRGILYRLAREIGCTKIALGHHRDDMLRRCCLNLFFAGQLAAMPPKLVSDDGDTSSSARSSTAPRRTSRRSRPRAFPILPCDLCGSQDNLQRKIVGDGLDKTSRRRQSRWVIKGVMLAATQNVRASHLLDAGLWKKLGLEVAREEEIPRSLRRERNRSPRRACSAF